MLSPLYAKLRPRTYRPLLSLKETTTLRWWAVALAHMKPRRIRQRHPAPERIVYTDAAGKSQFIADAVLTPGAFEASDTIGSITSSKTATAWKKTFGKTCYIYGLSMLEVLSIHMA